jgi:hypothetical protein
MICGSVLAVPVINSRSDIIFNGYLGDLNLIDISPRVQIALNHSTCNGETSPVYSRQ